MIDNDEYNNKTRTTTTAAPASTATTTTTTPMHLDDEGVLGYEGVTPQSLRRCRGHVPPLERLLKAPEAPSLCGCKQGHTKRSEKTKLKFTASSINEEQEKGQRKTETNRDG